MAGIDEQQRPSLSRRLVAEGVGTALLVAVVIGSGIMAQRLASGNAAVALLGNTLATGAALPVLILIFGPLSGAHFNPAVTIYFAARRQLALGDAATYVPIQVIGGLLGMLLAHAMFELPLAQVSSHLRNGAGQILGEFIATLLLLATIVGTDRRNPGATPFAVGLVISAGYWFTSSTSFANPAVTIARSLSDTFAGIAPSSAPGFIFGQMAAVAVAAVVFGRFFSDPAALKEPSARERLSGDTSLGSRGAAAKVGGANQIPSVEVQSPLQS
jgi:glycerol uptake facilitator-like aquaporin